MPDTAITADEVHHARRHRTSLPHLNAKPPPVAVVIFLALLAGGLAFMLFGLTTDLSEMKGEPLAISAFVLLGIALLIALGFEFVNGFHDTANAVATVIYTHAMPAQLAVLWSGSFNLLGVLLSSGAVAFAVVSLLPVELILQVGSNAGYDMIFALLISAILWNLGTWFFGLPASSSHTLVGSIIGVGLANQIMDTSGNATSGVDWNQVSGVFKALLISPVVGFAGSALMLILMKLVVRQKKLYEPPDTSHPPPPWIRGLLVLTCTGVSFAHGSNDGQKGMGLIMLILIGVAPTAYALNRTMTAESTPAFIQTVQKAHELFVSKGTPTPLSPEAAKVRVTAAVSSRNFDDPEIFNGLATLSAQIAATVSTYGTLAQVPVAAVENTRNQMYLASEAVRLLPKGSLTGDQQKVLSNFKSALDASTRFIPLWVKVSVAIALGLGTMVGWKRIVVTVGEKIGKTHLTYGQGASAELVAAATIMAADMYGLPVSTTHVLSSGIAGTMAANGSGLQWSTVRSIALAWVLTLPAAMLISGTLYYLFRSIF